MIKRIRAVVGVLYALGYIAYLALLGLRLARSAARRLAQGDMSRYRNELARRMVAHGDRLFRRMCTLFAVSVRFHLPEGVDFGQITEPLLVASSHQSLFDTPLLCAVGARIGRLGLRWVLKADLRKVPPFGPAAEELSCASLKRSKGDPEDRAQLERCARAIEADGADGCVIFPEGTRFKGAEPGSPYAYLRRPNPGGVYHFLKRLPQMSVLSVTLRWSGTAPNRPVGHGVLNALDVVGRTLDIWLEYVPREQIDQDSDWLNNHWRSKEERLWRAHQAEQQAAI